MASAPLHYRLPKRVLDVTGAVLGLVVLAPAIVVLAALTWVQDPHAPIFFRQERTGLGGRRFRLLKFRTMVRNADELKEQLRHLSSVPWPDFRLERDPRVTRLGRFLRRTSLDEVPQLYNVLVGDMSLVGPRPTSFAADTYAPWQAGRLDYRPGLTGPWQVMGRTSMDFDQRCRLEIRFFRTPSLQRELWLLVATVREVFRRSGVA